MARQKTLRLAISLLGYLPPTFLRPYPEAQVLPLPLLSRDRLRVSLARTPRSQVLASPKPFPAQVAIGPTRFACVEALLLGQCSTQAALLLRLQPEDYTSQHAQQKEGGPRRSAPRDYSLWLHCVVAGFLVALCDLVLVCGRVIVSRPRHAKNQISNDPAGESCSLTRRVPPSRLRSEAHSPRAAVGGGLSYRGWRISGAPGT